MLNKAKNLKMVFGTVWYLVRQQFERITVPGLVESINFEKNTKHIYEVYCNFNKQL
jgi:hypothetical protein